VFKGKFQYEGKTQDTGVPKFLLLSSSCHRVLISTLKGSRFT